ncbi:Cysteine desulfurase [Granulicella tundricola MP5ACTX9]|uniref:cysteine desulfurase n=2 Tax=Granulicella TaxID=940557 RepID=E8X2C2_GRATM|nr:Cysteine desulfurase [Granulicella tundricola MP5ACTX9]
MDANATTPLLPEVFDAMRPYLLEHFGNASSIHQPGQYARAAVDHAREQMAGLLRCRASEIVFTSGGTESDNLALFGTLGFELGAGQHLITSTIEHHAVLHAAEALEKRGVSVTFLPCTSAGLVEPEALRSALRPETRLVSVMLANNETGSGQPVAELAGIAKAYSKDILVHTDGVQAAGKMAIDLSAKGPLKDVDLLSISGHKMYAPQGTGVLFTRRNVRLAPLFHGGTHERQRRAGTENVAGIVALGKAAEIAAGWLSDGAGPAELAGLRDRFEQTLLREIAEMGVNGAGTERTPNTANLYFDHVEAEALVIALDLKGLSVSGGSACQSGATEPSHVLTAMGLGPARARASVRFSMSRLTTAEDVDLALALVPEAVGRLRSLSPTWKARERGLAAV